MAIVMALQNGPETAQSLADRLEVSKRTILRDMQALAEMGVPLYAMPGPAGGYRLMEGYKLPPLQFSSDEALVVLFALNAMIKIADTPFNQARWTALDKIRSVLPESLLHQIEPLLTKMEFEIPDRQYSIPNLEPIIRCAAESRWVSVHYRSENRTRWLNLLPIRIYTSHGYWYCEAYSQEHQEERTFRIDRMTEVVELGQPPAEVKSERLTVSDAERSAVKSEKSAVRKSEQSTAGQIGTSSETNADKRESAALAKPDTSRKSERVRICARLTYRGALLAEQDKHFGHLVRQVSDDEWMLDFMCPVSEWRWLVKFFYSLALDAEVLEPGQLREEIRSMAAEVIRHYDRNSEQNQDTNQDLDPT